MHKQYKRSFSNPLNLTRKLKTAFKDVLAHLTMALDSERELAYRVLASQLEDRIITAMDKSVFFDSIDYPRLLEFDPRDPMDTLFKVKGKIYTLKDLPSVYDTPKLRLKGRSGLVQDVKAGYVSWQKDYASDLELLNQKKAIKGNRSTFLFMLSKVRTYKLLWRLLTTAASFGVIAVILYKISGIFFMLSKFGTMSYMVTNSQLASGLLTMSAPVFAYKVLKLIESAFLKRKVNIDKFDSMSKTSTQFPQIQKFLLQQGELL